MFSSLGFLYAVSLALGSLKFFDCQPLKRCCLWTFLTPQANSEHSRHWFFSGKMVIDGEEQAKTLFNLVKETLPKVWGRPFEGMGLPIAIRVLLLLSVAVLFPF